MCLVKCRPSFLVQAFLRTGIMKSKRAPTVLHPYGYHRDKFIWSLIAAVGIFCIGAGVNIVQGLNALFAEKQLEFLRANLAGELSASCLWHEPLVERCMFIVPFTCTAEV